ncbi:hypothetical protein YERSI8AC_100355 [Enterobacterales bacterium 8AC]|nr:hypothetical protein YERSI8AC_100355 [Enterobacterales bacterium 8AC]
MAVRGSHPTAYGDAHSIDLLRVNLAFGILPKEACSLVDGVIPSGYISGFSPKCGVPQNKMPCNVPE